MKESSQFRTQGVESVLLIVVPEDFLNTLLGLLPQNFPTGTLV
jgi:hypothetical protein